MRTKNRFAMRRFKRSGTDAYRLTWIKQLMKATHAFYEEKERRYWPAKIAASDNNMKKAVAEYGRNIERETWGDVTTVTALLRTLLNTFDKVDSIGMLSNFHNTATRHL